MMTIPNIYTTFLFIPSRFLSLVWSGQEYHAPCCSGLRHSYGAGGYTFVMVPFSASEEVGAVEYVDGSP